MAEAQRQKPVSETLDDERPRPDSEDRATFRHHLARYHFASNFIRLEYAVLETGCGTGYGAHILAKSCRSFLATDYSPLAIAYAQENFHAPNLTFAVLDCRQMELETGRFDCVISFEVFEHLEDQAAYLRNCHRVLRPRGFLLLSTPNRVTSDIHMKSIGQINEFHIGTVDLDELRARLKPHFARVEVYGQRRRGNWLYNAARALDVFNLRLRLINPARRESLQQKLGVAAGTEANGDEWVFSRRQLRQCNHFVAVCRKES